MDPALAQSDEAEPISPRPVVPLSYGSAEISAEWRIVLRVLASMGCLVSAGRIISFGGGVLFLFVYRSSAAGTFPSQATRVGGLLGGILLCWGSILIFKRQERRGAGLIIIGEWINLSFAGLYVIFALASATVQNRAAQISANSWLVPYVYGFVSSLGYGLTMIPYSLLYILLLRAYRRASGIMR